MSNSPVTSEFKQAGHDRIVGSLLGGALGGALGYPVEFPHSWTTIASMHGRHAPVRLAYAHTPPALISDDTQMTLFVTEGLIRAVQRTENRGICNPGAVLFRALQRWYATQVVDLTLLDRMASAGYLLKERRLLERRAPGQTNLSALEASVNGSPKPNRSKGCGAVMRSAPIGLAAKSIEIAWQMARDSAADTHGHPSGQLSAAYFASVIHAVAHGSPLSIAMREADALLAKEQNNEEVARAIAQARALASGGAPEPDPLESLGEGWVAEEALAIALACALTSEGDGPQATAETLWRSVLHRGDSDSTGSLTGNLLGAIHGVRCLPQAWLAELELRDVIERLAEDLFRSAWLGEYLDTEDYPPH